MRTIAARYVFNASPEETLERLREAVPPALDAAASKDGGAFGRITPEKIWLAWRKPSPQWVFFQGAVRQEGAGAVLEGTYSAARMKVGLVAVWMAFLCVMSIKLLMIDVNLRSLVPVVMGWGLAVGFAVYALKGAQTHVTKLDALLKDLSGR